MSSGEGIRIVDVKSEKNIEQLWSELKDTKYLVEEVVYNCEEIRKYNNSSCNTIRIYTLVEKDGSVTIVNALIRVGANNSAVDNYHSGGVGAAIDIETGIVFTMLYDCVGNGYVLHPTNGIRITGDVIPRWEELKQRVIEAAKVLPESRWIAWDICITPNDFEFIEGNYKGDPGFLQAIDHRGKYYFVKSRI